MYCYDSKFALGTFTALTIQNIIWCLQVFRVFSCWSAHQVLIFYFLLNLPVANEFIHWVADFFNSFDYKQLLSLLVVLVLKMWVFWPCLQLLGMHSMKSQKGIFLDSTMIYADLKLFLYRIPSRQMTDKILTCLACAWQYHQLNWKRWYVFFLLLEEISVLLREPKKEYLPYIPVL